MNNTLNNSKKIKFTHWTMKTVLKLGIIINLPSYLLLTVHQYLRNAPVMGQFLSPSPLAYLPRFSLFSCPPSSLSPPPPSSPYFSTGSFDM